MLVKVLTQKTKNHCLIDQALITTTTTTNTSSDVNKNNNEQGKNESIENYFNVIEQYLNRKEELLNELSALNLEAQQKKENGEDFSPSFKNKFAQNLLRLADLNEQMEQLNSPPLTHLFPTPSGTTNSNSNNVNSMSPSLESNRIFAHSNTNQNADHQFSSEAILQQIHSISEQCKQKAKRIFDKVKSDYKV